MSGMAVTPRVDSKWPLSTQKVLGVRKVNEYELYVNQNEQRFRYKAKDLHANCYNGSVPFAKTG